MLIFLLFTLLPVLIFLAGVYLGSKNKKNNIKSRKSYKTSRANKTQPKYTITEIFVNEVPPPIESIKLVNPKHKLINMVGGDKAAAQRLMEHEQKLNPGHFENWYWEKAIYRLERDRHV